MLGSNSINVPTIKIYTSLGQGELLLRIFRFVGLGGSIITPEVLYIEKTFAAL